MFVKYIDRELALKTFRYCEISGYLFWRIGNRKGKVAGTVNSNGYCVIDWQGKKYYAHRIISQMLSDYDIVSKICDHRNYKKDNNIASNISLGTQRENLLRRRKTRKSSLRYRGIIKRVLSYGTFFIANITVNNKRYYGDHMTTQKAAYRQYLAMCVLHNGVDSLCPKMLRDYVLGA